MTFQKIKETRLPNTHVLSEFEHFPSGAKWFHLADGNDEKTFVVGFHTPPDSDEGTPRVLEHMVLCGSEKFPVKDPFFKMLRRSLATFMNAMTYPDRTVYPFSTVSDKDYFNLLGVYLDAVFFPKLERLDFEQEGWRLEIGEDGNPRIQGVVYNEMKGARAPAASVLYHGARRIMFDGTPLMHDYGGDPASIPHLTVEKVREFHATHYHPSNSVFMTSGNIDIAEVQQFVEKHAIGRFSPIPRTTHSYPASRATGVHRIPVPKTSEKNEIQYIKTWNLGKNLSPLDRLQFTFLAELLVGNSASPMLSAIENSGIGVPGDFIGIDTGTETLFWLGIGGLGHDDIDAARTLILSELERLSEEGFDSEQELSALREFDLQSRKSESGRTPYSMSMLLSSIGHAMNGEDIIPELDKTYGLDILAAEVESGGFGKKLLKRMLAATSAPEFISQPDVEFSEKLSRAEKVFAREISARKTIRPNEETVQPHGNIDILPTLTETDIPKKPLPSVHLDVNLQTREAHASTNGLLYASYSIEVPRIDFSNLSWLALAAMFAGDLGVGALDYSSTTKRRSSIMSDDSAHMRILSDMNGSPRVFVTLAGTMLERDGLEGIDSLIYQMMDVRFDEAERWNFLIDDFVLGFENQLSDAGPSFASEASFARFSPASRLRSRISAGGEPLRFIRDLRRLSSTPQGLESIMHRCQSAWNEMLSGKHVFDLVGENTSKFADKIELPYTNPLPFKTSDSWMQKQSSGLAMLTQTGGASCFSTRKLSRRDPSYVSAVAVAAAAMSHCFLHEAVREKGGAYGSAARVHTDDGVLSFSSFRDPRVSGTLADFDNALDWFINRGPSSSEWHESKLSVVQADRPLSPVKEAYKALSRYRTGETDEYREAFRNGVISADISMAREFISEIANGESSRAVFCGDKHADECTKVGLKIDDLAR